MSKRKHPAYPDTPDGVTYQTGPITPPKSSSGLLAFLLAAVIFLGGMVSAMGLINIRLLTRLNLPPDPAMLPPASSFPATTAVPALEENTDPAPQIPSQRKLELTLRASPYYAENPDRESVSCDSVYRRSADSLVEVHSITHCNDNLSGAGVVLSEDGYILTNTHVIDAAKRIFVYLPDGRLLRAALVGSDPLTDLAVLYVEAKALTPAEFGTSDSLQVTEPVFAADPDDPRSLLQSSIFSISRTFSTTHFSLELIQTCQRQPGGPMLNHQGQIAGIYVGRIARYFGDDAADGLGLVLPTSAVKSIVHQLVQQGFIPSRPDLGVEVEAISKLYQHYWELPGGLLLTAVDAAAQAQGLQKGDILLALDGKPMMSRDDLYATLFSENIGDPVTAVIFRDGQKFTVPLIIAETEA